MDSRSRKIRDRPRARRLADWSWDGDEDAASGEAGRHNHAYVAGCSASVVVATGRSTPTGDVDVGDRTRRCSGLRRSVIAVASLLVVAGAFIPAAPASAAVPSWTTTAVSTLFANEPLASQPVSVREVGTDASGNRYVAGYFYGPTVFGPGSAGTMATVGTNVNTYLVSYTSAGALRWVHRIANGLTAELGGIAVTPSGTVVLAMTTFGTVHISTPYGDRTVAGHGALDVFVATFAGSDGHIIWARTDGGTGSDRVSRVALDFYGNVYLVGSFATWATFGDTPAVTLNVSGGYVNGFAASYTAAGTLRWATDVVTGGNESLTGLAVGGGGVYVSGTYPQAAVVGGVPVTAIQADSVNSFLARLSPIDGSFRWVAKVRPQGAGPYAVSITPAVSSAGEVYLVGSTHSTVEYRAPDGAGYVLSGPQFLLRVQSSGAFIWGHGFAAARVVTPLASPPGFVTVAGTFSGTIALNGDVSLTSSGGTDGFVAQWSSAGALTRAARFGGPGNDNPLALAGSGDAPLLAAQVGPGTDTLPGGNTIAVAKPSGDVVLAALASA